jgi:membrane associated rhomboid family serine protease
MLFSHPDRPQAVRPPTAVRALVATMVALAFVQATLLRGDVLPQALGFRWAGIEGRPWSVATYMMAHAGLWHLTVNLYGLVAFGPRLEQAWGTRRFLWFFLFSGVGGVLLHALLVRDGGVMIGASSAVFGVLFACAAQWPRERVHLLGIIPVRAGAAAVAFIALTLLVGFSDAGGVAYLAHLGGVMAAWFYLRTPSTDRLADLRDSVSRVPDAADDAPPRVVPRPQQRPRERLDEADEIVARSKALARRTPAPAPVRPPRIERTEVDRVLDKISAHGIESLTETERQLLERAAGEREGRE